MSVKISLKTVHKKQIAVIVKEIANLVSMSSNDQVSVDLDVKFCETEEIGK